MTKLSKEQIQAFAVKYPGRYEELKKQLAQARQRELVGLERLQKALIVYDVPDIDLSNVEGLVAFRQWGVENGELCSTSLRSAWKSVMFADRVPTPDNTHGLYCIKLSPFGFMSPLRSYIDGVCGLIELRGKIVEHYDGVMRAEWARILCVFWCSCNANVYSGVPALIQNYPGIPIYVTTVESLTQLLFRIVVWQEGVRHR